MTDHFDDYDDFDDAPEPEAGDHEFDGPAALDDDAAWTAEPTPDPAPIAEPDLDPEPEAAPESAPVAQDELFPPALDVGELPEPVDGFPWADAATLGAGVDEWAPPVDAVEAGELAEYAASEAADFETLAASEDPATAALARFWSENG